MRKFSINCDFGGQLAPFDIFIGQPEQSHHPLHFQADWLLKQRGGTILPEVMDAIAKLNTLALENGVPLEDLCVYALGSAQEETAPADTATPTEEALSAESQVEEAVAEESPVEPYETQAVDEISTDDTAGESSSGNQTEDTDENPSETIDSTAMDNENETPLETLNQVATPADAQENSEPQKAQDALNDEPPIDENKQ
jgi:hypothetical protein